MTRKIKMIGLAFILSLGVIGGAITISKINPSIVLADNNNQVHQLSALIDVNGKAMQVYGSNQEDLHNLFLIDVKHRTLNNQKITRCTWDKNIGDKKFYLQKVTSLDITIYGSGNVDNTWIFSFNGHDINCNYDDSSKKLIVPIDDSFINIDEFKITQTSNSGSVSFYEIYTIKIGFDCQNQ